MVHRHISVAESYSVLGLSEGATLEVVRSTYKQLALKTHPDKNPGDANATVHFQRISEAYNMLLKHLDKSTPLPRPQSRAYNPFTGPRFDSDDEYDEYDYFDDEDDYYNGYDSDDDYFDAERMDFYMFLFEEMMRGGGGCFSRTRFHQECDCPLHRRQREEQPRETEEQYQYRVRRAREEQEIAEERRKREATHKKARQEEERAKERREAEKRQKDKATKKKVQAETLRRAAEDKVRTQQQESQRLRSSVFAAARQGDAAAVKKGIWQDSVDAAGGEVKKGCEDFVKSAPKDAYETLSHIAVSCGDVELFEWLDTHSADQEERNSQGLTAFHAALSRGCVPILKYVLENHPPEDAGSLYEQSSHKSNLQLAVDSRIPEAVWLVLENKLCSEADIAHAWKQIMETSGPPTGDGTMEEIVNMLVSYGHLTTDHSSLDEHTASTPSSGSTSSITDEESHEPISDKRHRGPPSRQSETTPQPTPPPSPLYPAVAATEGSPPSTLRGTGPRGRARGRGRGRGRGFRGRGRGSN